MPLPPYAKVQISINGGAVQSGGLDLGTLAASVSVQLSPESSIASSKRWEIYSYPVGWTTPSGWTLDSEAGVIYSTATTPPAFTIPAAATLFGKWLIRLTFNGGQSADPEVGARLIDENSGISTKSTLGLEDIGYLEANQFSSTREQEAAHQANLRVIEAGIADAGGNAATITALYAIRTGNADALFAGQFIYYSTAYGRFRPCLDAHITASDQAVAMITDATIVDVAGVPHMRASADGIWAASVSQLAAGSVSPCRINTANGLAQRVTAIIAGDRPVGSALSDGAIALAIGVKETGFGGRTILASKYGWDTTSSDNAPAAALAIAAAQKGDTVIFDYAYTGFVVRSSFDLSNKVGIRLQFGVAPNAGLAGCPVIFKIPERKGTAASITATSGNGALGWYTQTWTGLTGAALTSLDVGKLIDLGGGATATNNGVGVITTVLSATSAKIAVRGPAGTDASNGALTWHIQNIGFKMHGRENDIEGAWMMIGDTSSDLCDGVSFSQSHIAGQTVTTRGRVKGVFMTPNLVAVNTRFRRGISLGNPILPNSDNYAYRVDNAGNPVPWVPYNCDYLHVEDVTTEALEESWSHTINNSGQIRGLVFERCTVLRQPFGILTESGTPAVPNLEGSIGFETVSDFSVGAITDTVFKGRTNGPWTIRGLQLELAKRLLDQVGSTGTPHEVTFDRPYINITAGAGATDAASPWVIAYDGPVNITGGYWTVSNPIGSLWSPFQVLSVEGIINVEGGAQLPDESQTGAPIRHPGSFGVVHIGRGCKIYNSVTGIRSISGGARGDSIYVFSGEPFEAPTFSAGTSSTGTRLRQREKRIRISGAARTATWTFDLEEVDPFFSAQITIDSTSGAPAAGALKWKYFVTGKKICVALEAAPGGSEWVTLNITLSRSGRGALQNESTFGTGFFGMGGWYPSQLSGARMWLRADIGLLPGTSPGYFRWTQQVTGHTSGGFQPEQATPADQPLLISGLSGSSLGKSIDLSGTKLFTGCVLDLATVTNPKVIMIGAPGGGGVEERLWGQAGATYPAIMKLASGNFAMRGQINGGIAALDSGVAWNTTKLVRADFVGTTGSVYVDSFTAAATGTIDSAGTVDRWKFGENFGGKFNGTIDDFLIFDSTPSGTELQTLKDYYNLIHGRSL